MCAEPLGLGLEIVGERDPRLPVDASSDVAVPVAVEVKSTDVGILGTADAQGAVGIAAQRGIRVYQQVDEHIGSLVIVAEVQEEILCQLPIGEGGGVEQALVARHPRAGGVVERGIDFEIGEFQGAARYARQAAEFHGVVVVGAGEIGADRIEEHAVVFNVGQAMIQAAAGAIAAGDTERGLRGGADAPVLAVAAMATQHSGHDGQNIARALCQRRHAQLEGA